MKILINADLSALGRSALAASSAVLIALVLSGCSRWLNDDKGFIVDRSDDYLKVEVREDLEVPSDLNDGRVDDPFAIPKITNPKGSTFPDQAPRPVPILAKNDSEGVKIQKLGDRRWLVLTEAPSVVWPKLKQFLAENAINTVTEEALKGRITTDWFDVEEDEYRDVIRLAVAQGKADGSARGGLERVNFSVEQGMRENTTEIHVRHQNDQLDEAVDIADAQLLTTASSIFEVEESLLRELGGYLASEVSSQSVSRVGQNLVGATKAAIDTDPAGQPVLLLNLDFDRAWASVSQALDNAEVSVTDLDRSEGVFYIEMERELLTGEPVKKGFFGKRRGGNLLPLQILVVPSDDSGYLVSAVDSDAAAIDSDQARKVLSLIREFAI